jgi:hypothetical protein
VNTFAQFFSHFALNKASLVATVALVGSVFVGVFHEDGILHDLQAGRMELLAGS